MTKKRWENIRLIVVHDTAPIRNLLTKILQSFGLERIDSVDNGADALKLLNQHAIQGTPIHIVISDWHMPNMTGLELLSEMRKIPIYKKTPFLCVTSGINKDETVETIKAGVTDFIMNPISAPKLLEKMAKCIKIVKSQHPTL